MGLESAHGGKIPAGGYWDVSGVQNSYIYIYIYCVYVEIKREERDSERILFLVKLEKRKVVEFKF